ncbi:unnamed protein product [Phyllotreta striolata]|uniref:CHK kinase-like domain-containing protein n=1 Tax=Phyllotreta striolata TaxID=444603 RepID=A0A9N9U0L0_PHYSR|nr:unnamed protein product [Phyllotreta striolata]
MEDDGTTNKCKKHYVNFYKQESIVEDIPETHVLKSIEKKLGTNHYCLLTYKTEIIDKRLGFLGDYCYLQVSYLNEHGAKENSSFFVKYFPTAEILARLARELGSFEKESFVYKLFKQFAKDDINIIDNVATKCYVCKCDSYVILENLADCSFEPADKRADLDYDTVLVVLQALAQLHASSIVYEIKSGKKLIESYPGELVESFYNATNRKNTEASIKGISESIGLFDLDGPLKNGKRFSDVAGCLCGEIDDLVKPSGKYRNVLTHGDLWANNVMLKRDEKSGKAVGCKLVDFQCARYAPPAYDVLSFIYLTTSREFRRQHLYELTGIYYSYLERNLKRFGCNIDDILSFDDFMESCEVAKKFAIVLAAFYFPLVLIDNEKIEEYFADEELNAKAIFDNRIHLVLKHKDEDEFYRNRIVQSLQDLKELCQNYEN